MTSIVSLWNYSGRNNDVPVIQDMIQQKPDACSFAAVARQIEYQLRIAYAWAEPSVELPARPLIDHVKWQREYPDKAHWKPGYLFKQAEAVGVPLWNGLRHKVDRSMQTAATVDDIRNKLKLSPVVAVFPIREDFSWNGEEPYRGFFDPEYAVDEMGNLTDKIKHHAVVLVGEYRSPLPNETLWIYQNSGGDPEKSFLKRGMNCVDHDLIVEVFESYTFPVNLMVRKSAVAEVKRYRRD